MQFVAKEAQSVQTRAIRGRKTCLPRLDVNLEVGSGSHAQQTAQVMLRFEPVLLDYKPDWVIVPGDVNSTVACALVASKLGVKGQ